MKIKKLLFAITAVIMLISFSSSGTFAAVDEEVQNNSAKTLERMRLMIGDGKGNLFLKNNITRSEFVTMVVRLLGHDDDNNIDNVELVFDDSDEIRNWAVRYIKLALKYNLIKGYNDNTLRPNNYVTNAEAQTVLLRALGYGGTLEGKWPENVLEKSKEIGISSYVDLKGNHQLTRGETSVLVYNSLTVPLKE